MSQQQQQRTTPSASDENDQCSAFYTSESRTEDLEDTDVEEDESGDESSFELLKETTFPSPRTPFVAPEASDSNPFAFGSLPASPYYRKNTTPHFHSEPPSNKAQTNRQTHRLTL